MSSSPTGTTASASTGGTGGTGSGTTVSFSSSGTGAAGTTGATGPSGVSSSSATGAAPATGTTGATGATEEIVLGPDLYKWFVGAFLAFLSLIVLIATGSLLSVLVLLALIALLVSSLVYYGFLDIAEYVEPKVNPVLPTPAAKPTGGPLVGSEVFHVDATEVDGTGFTYDDAPAVCAAFESELATLEQVMEAYSKGAEWCNYGWTAGGMALYPTQKATWEALQKELDTERRTRCGRPGVNGGYMDPLLKLGVNCYGFKPKGDFKPPAPIPGGDPKEFAKAVSRFKEIMNRLLLSPFSRFRWSGVRATESFTGQSSSYGTQFRQSFLTPHGVVEHLVNGSATDPYVESVATSGGYGGSPYGLRGDTGPSGLTGARGLQGIQGVQGAQGEAGAQGPRGNEGPRGAASTIPGPTGPSGPRGERGEQGDAGRDSTAVGATGPKGDQGERGDFGPTGPKGASRTGPTGSPGAKGDPGDKGDKGDPGPLEPDLKVKSIQIGNHLLYAVNRTPNQPANEELLIQPIWPQSGRGNQHPPRAAFTWGGDKANLWLQNSGWGNENRNWRHLTFNHDFSHGGNNGHNDFYNYLGLVRAQPGS